MSRHKTKKRITAMVLSVMMVVGMMPVSAFAETSTLPISTSGEITTFEALGLDIAFRNVPFGTGRGDLELPDTLMATLRIAALEDKPLLDSGDADGGSVASPSDAEKAGGDIEEISVALPVTWACAPEYDGEAAGTYVFMPELPEGFILTDGIELPTITLTVSEGEASVFAARGMSISLPNGAEYPETVEGLGTEEDPLRIETAAQLAALAWSVNHGSLPDSLPEYPYLILVNDLDLSVYNENEDGYGKGWVPIGGYYGGCYDEDGDIETYAFSGTFDGNHKTIRNLYVERGERYVGLFGYVKEGAVKNLTVENGDVEGYAATGGIVGALYKGQIENCVFSGSVAGEEATGGIVGDLGDSKVEDCRNTGSITGKAVTGGIVGGAGNDSENDYLRNCINTGTVTGSDAYTGGIVGLLVGMTADYCVNTGTVQGGADLNTGGVAGTISEGIIQNCVNGGSVQGGTGRNTGGVAGEVYDAIMQNCVNTGGVSGDANNIGGLAGLMSAGTIQNCINYADVSSIANSVGGVAGFAQEGSAVTNCLTTGNISGKVESIERGGVSGVVGWLQNGSGDANTLSSCVALGQTVIKDGDKGNVARIAAMDDIWDNTVSDNFAWSGMQLFWGEELIPEEGYHWLKDGENADVTTLYTLWTTGALAESWSDAGVWTLAEGKLSVLTGLPHQSDEFPSHISGIAVVMVSPDAVSVQKGATKGFTATVTGIGTIDDTVTWRVDGAAHAGTTIDSTGMLTVAADETAESLIVTATATGDSSKKGTASVTVKDEPAVPDLTYIVNLNGGGLGATGSGSYTGGTTVNIYAGNRSNYTFTGWTSSDVTITNASSKNASFVMPDKAVTVTAGWRYNGGGSYTPPTPPAPPVPTTPPNQPVTATIPVTATAGTNGTASANIPASAITDAIAKAQADAKAQGNDANGISVELNVTMPQGATSLTVTIPQSAIQSLVSPGVSQLAVNGAPVALGLNQSALQSIQNQASGGITISMTPVTGLSAPAQSMIGSRPVYKITISYTNQNGATQNITSFGNGTATFAFSYTPGRNEASGYLFGVYVDGNGKASRIPGSVYDANSRSILVPTNHLSVYGVGYEAPSDKFTDISTHWGKEAIDYVVGRGLLSGTSKTTFAPNTAMTRGMLVTALGRLAGVDVKAYTTNSFTDVKADSAFRPYIEWAYSKGIIQGIGNSQFAPDRAITREEIAVIFANYAKATGYALPITREASIYADASGIGSAYKDAVKAMQQAGIMMGGSDNKFNPKGNATRAEVSSMLGRYIKLTINPATAQGWAQNDAGQYLYYKDGKALTGTQTIDGVKYFFNTDGTLKNGWVKDGDNWRFYSGKTMLVGFWDLGANGNNKTYYFTKDGLMISGKWLEIDGKWYYFYTDGSLARSTKIDGYEVDKNGVRKTK